MLDQIAAIATARRPLWFMVSFPAAAFAVAFIVRYVVDPWLPSGFPFLTFFPAVILTSLICGWQPGVLVTLACALAAQYFFIPPIHSLELTPANSVALGFFLFIAFIDILIIHGMRVALDKFDVERRRAEKLARTRELMFQETQHRISNNLQVVAALLRLQRNAIQDDGARKALDEAANRTAVVAKIQRQLLNDRGEHASLGELIADVAQDSVGAAGESERIRLEVETDDVFVAPEKSIPLALVATELIANAVEHAFPGDRRGHIAVRLTRAGRGITLVVRDDGVGAPADYHEGKGSLGMRIVRQFVDQLGGRLDLRVDGGSIWTVEVPSLDADQRRDMRS